MAATTPSSQRSRGLIARMAGWAGRFLSAYAGGTVTRRDYDFVAKGLGPNAKAESQGSRDQLVKRVTDLIDDNPLVAGIVETRCDNVVGTGIDDVEPDTGWPDLDEQVAQLWEWATRRVDPERSMTLGESQELFCRELERAGECGVYRPWAPAFRGYPAMPALELICSERFPMELSGGLADGNTVRQGVEYDELGRTVAYHVLVSNPRDGGGFAFGGSKPWGLGAVYLGSPDVKRLQADACELAFRSTRDEQLRGVPRLRSLAAAVRMEGHLCTTTLDQATLAAALGIFFSGTGYEDLFKTSAPLVDASGNPLTRVEGASIGFLRPGVELKTAGGNIPGPTFESTLAGMHRRISRGARLPYATFSGDSSRANFASQRADALDARKSYRPDQHFLWRHHTEPWRRDLLNWGVLTGRIVLSAEQAVALARSHERLYRCNPGFLGFEYVNPAQEAAAVGEDIANGVRSRIEAIQERGANWHRVVRDELRYFAFLRDEAARQGVDLDQYMKYMRAGGGAGGASDAARDGDNPASGGGAGGSSGRDGGGERSRAERWARLARVVQHDHLAGDAVGDGAANHANNGGRGHGW